MDPRITTVMRYQEAYFQRMSSVSFEATSELEMSEWGQENFARKTGRPVTILADDLTHSLRFAWEDGKFLYVLRQRTHDDGVPQQPLCAESFDGLTDFEQDHDVFATSLGLTRDRQPCGEHPFEVLFHFVVPARETLIVSNLYESRTWRTAMSRAAAIRDTTFEGAPGLEIDFADADGGGVYWRVFFASASDYLPMRVQSFFADGRRRNECVVNEVKTCETAVGPVHFPMRIECKNWVTSGNLASTELFAIDSETMLVNTDLPDEMFALPLPDAYGSPDAVTGGVISVDARLAKNESFVRDLLGYIATHEGELDGETRSHLSPRLYEQLDDVVAQAVTRAIGDFTRVGRVAYAAPVGGIVQVTWSILGNVGEISMRLQHDRTGLLTDIDVEVGAEWTSLSEFAAESLAPD